MEDMNTKLENENNRLKLNIIDLNDSLGVKTPYFRGKARSTEH